MRPDELDPDNGDDFVLDHPRMRSRYTERLRRRGVPNAEVAAAVIAARGRAGETIDEFAARLKVDPQAVRGAEAGNIEWERLPPSLAFAVRRN